MKKISFYLFSLIIFYQSSLLAYSADPKDFIHELVNDAISKLSNKSLSEEQKANFIEDIA